MALEAGDVQEIAVALQALLPAPPAVPPAAVSSVSIKLPPFWTTRPEVWFRQVEAQFATRSPPITTDLTKFNHVVAALDNVTAGEVEAIILSPPMDDKYNALKTALISVFKLPRTWSSCPCLVSGIESLPASYATWSPSMLIPRPSSVLSSSPSCPWKRVASLLVRPRLTLRLWPRRQTLSWRRALWVSAPPASLECANRRPHPRPRNCASTIPSSVRRPESATSEGARWPISSRLPLPLRLLRPLARETGRPAAKTLRGRPMGEKHNDSVGPPLMPLLPC